MNKCIATFFFLGLSPYAPGTVGTLGAAVLYALLWYFQYAVTFVLLICLLAVSVLNILIGNWAENHFGMKDPGAVVIDEVAGYFMTILFFHPSWSVLCGGFILFRVFDIWKPYPINMLEKLPSGFGILLDDIMAGIYAAATLCLISLALYSYQVTGYVVPSLWNW